MFNSAELVPTHVCFSVCVVCGLCLHMCERDRERECVYIPIWMPLGQCPYWISVFISGVNCMYELHLGKEKCSS